MSISTSFESFLENLAVELQRLRAEPNLFRVTRLRQGSGMSHQISIGIGHQAQPGTSASTSTFPVALNNKSEWEDYFQGRASSVALLVSKAPDKLFELWRDNINAADRDAPPPQLSLCVEDASPVSCFPLSQLSLCVEDASPDSCFGLLIFVAVLRGVPREHIPKQWISYIDGWERGFASHDPAAVEYGVLHNALVHGLVDRDLRGAWIDGLALLTSCLSRNVDSRAIDTATDNAIIARAAAALRFEQAAYAQSRDVMTQLQIELPLAAHPDRRLLVDAILAEERLLMGIQKVCFRTDRAHSFLGRGYTVNAIYRPEARGDGNDITFSLDPASGLSLRSLWEALEREEDLLWGENRPRADPRADLSGYPGGRRPDGSSAPEQPWYHNHDFTLIAAPKLIADGRQGSKLDWSAVRAVLWKEYSPFNRIHILPGTENIDPAQASSEDRITTLQDCQDEPLQGISDRRRLRIGRWLHPDNTVLPLRWSPTLGRMLAACLRHPRSSSPISFDDLQAAPAHSNVTFGSGLAVISQHGAYLLIHHLATGIKVCEMRASFKACAGAMDWIDKHTDEVAGLMGNVRDHLSGRRTAKLSRDLQTYNRICTLQLDLLKLRYRLEAGSLDLSSQEFRDAIMRGWGVTGRLDALYRDLEEAKIILTAHGELVTNRRIAFLTYFGFPLALAGSLAGLMFAAEPVWPLSLATIDWLPLVSFLGIALLGSLVLFGFSWTGDRKARLDSLAPPDRVVAGQDQSGSDG